jgi:acetylornithine deacetylase/succinyl-diaminopimelate desuccinylase-like protein
MTSPVEAAVDALADEARATLGELLRIPSLSSDPAHRPDLLRCAGKVEALLCALGFRTDRFDAGGFPSIVGECGPARGPTVLLYSHYDVQPARLEDGWSHEPFDPVVVDGNVIARGASDDKGQLTGLLYGLMAYRRAHGELPCRVRFLCEGAEEVGSPGFEAALVANRDKIAADLAIIADCGRFVPERPGLIRALRGLAYLEVTVTGARADLHSGTFGGAVDNPAAVVARMLAALKDADHRIAVPGFYDDVVPPTPAELAELRAVPFDERAYCARIGVPRLVGEHGYDVHARRWLRPALDVNGITAGHGGPGAKTVLPARASCKLSCRLVPRQDPDRILELLERFFRALCPSTCAVTFARLTSAPPVKLDLAGPSAHLVLAALERGYGAAPLTIYEGATVPVVAALTHGLGIPSFPIGFARTDDRAHGPDEKFALEDLARTMRTTAYLLEEIARARS